MKECVWTLSIATVSSLTATGTQARNRKTEKETTLTVRVNTANRYTQHCGLCSHFDDTTSAREHVAHWNFLRCIDMGAVLEHHKTKGHICTDRKLVFCVEDQNPSWEQRDSRSGFQCCFGLQLPSDFLSARFCLASFAVLFLEIRLDFSEEIECRGEEEELGTAVLAYQASTSCVSKEGRGGEGFMLSRDQTRTFCWKIWK